MRCTQIVEAGAYVLGALSPGERSMYQRHMATCTECRGEVADLAGLPGLLGRLDEATAAGLSSPGSANAVQAPPTLLPDVLRRAGADRARSRRRNRWRMAVVGAAAAACAAVVASLALPASVNQATPVPPGVVLAAMDAVQQGEPVTAVIGYGPTSNGGTEIYMSCMYVDSPGKDDDWTFKLVVFRRGAPESTEIKRWSAYPGQYVHFAASTSWAPADIDRIEVQLMNGTRLLSYQAT